MNCHLIGEMNCHFIGEMISHKLVFAGYVKIGELEDISKKVFSSSRVDYTCNKLGIINIYTLILT